MSFGSWARVRRKELNSSIAHSIFGSGSHGNSSNHEQTGYKIAKMTDLLDFVSMRTIASIFYK